MDIKEENFQITKFSSSDIDLLVLNRSENGDLIETLDIQEKPLLVIGDFNFCFTRNSLNPAKKYLKDHCFTQLIKDPIHTEGNLLDQAYVRDKRNVLDYSSELHSKYYSDHKALVVIIKKNELRSQQTGNHMKLDEK